MRRKKETSRTETYEEKKSVGTSLKIGAVAITFLVIGYQAALFVNSSAVAQLIANRDAPDTVYVTGGAPTGHLTQRAASPVDYRGTYPQDPLTQRAASPVNYRGTYPPDPLTPLGASKQTSAVEMTDYRDASCVQSGSPSAASGLDGRKAGRENANGNGGGGMAVRRDAVHSEAADRVYLKQRQRRAESFPFDPNTVSVTDLQRLGFSEKQALSIDAYRKKGGRFRRSSDFAKSYVVSDSVFRRLEPYIRIPKLDINAADSAAFDGLPGIGGYFASKMVEYRERLHGYSYPEQLMDIRNFDEDKFSGLADLITVGPSEPYALWTLPEEELSSHPYIGSRASAHSIVLFRENHRPEDLTPEALGAAGILDTLNASRLARCRIAALF